jgi:hypothetical protein
MAYQATTGLGTQTQILVDASTVALSLSGVNTHQIAPTLADASSTAVPAGTALVLSAVASASGGTTVYTGTITGGGSNALVGQVFTVAGFANPLNNGSFECTASTTTTLTLANTAGVAVTAAGTATSEDSTLVPTYVSYFPSVATVSATGLITGVSKGFAVIEVSYPAFSNAVGNVVSTGNIMNGLPLVKIFKEINVTVGV